MVALLRFCLEHYAIVLICLLAAPVGLHSFFRSRVEKRAQAMIKDFQKRELRLSQLEHEYADREASLLTRENSCKKLYSDYSALLQAANRQETVISSESNRRSSQYISNLLLSTAQNEHFSGTLVYRALSGLTTDGILDRFQRAQTRNIRFSAPIFVSTQMRGSSGKNYTVTLDSCTCIDFQTRHIPCKHMLKLALEVGLLVSIDTSRQQNAINEFYAARKSLAEQEKRSGRAKADLDKIVNEKSQRFPWLSKLFSDYFDMLDGQLEERLRNKRHPALRAADEVRQIRIEKRSLQTQCKSMESQLHFYETLFPWLEEFKELPPIDAYQVAASVGSETSGDEYESLRPWLSPDEYQHLSAQEKFQLALERYQNRPKSSWEIGIEYERYIGYLCEQEGYRVSYNGANLGLEDMGRDLILSRGSARVVIQCKRWAKEKRIHEKHIFQLFGSCILLELQSPETTVKGVFVTTATLSDTARSCASRLGIQVYEEVPIVPYPMVKCNISSSGEKIYHLPFDQQYDRVVIDSARGERFVFTVSDAEGAGFRRARRHNPT